MNGTILLILTVLGSDYSLFPHEEVVVKQEIPIEITELRSEVANLTDQISRLTSEHKEENLKTLCADYMTLEQLWKAVANHEVAVGRRIMLLVQLSEEEKAEWARKCNLCGRTLVVCDKPHKDLSRGAYHYMLDEKGGLTEWKNKPKPAPVERTYAPSAYSAPVYYTQPQQYYTQPQQYYTQPSYSFFGSSSGGGCASGQCGS